MLKAINDYVIVEPIEDEQLLAYNSPEATMSGKVVDPGKYAGSILQEDGSRTHILNEGDTVHFWQHAAAGQIVMIDDKQLMHIKYDRIMSVEI